MFGWGRLARPSPPQAAPQPQTTGTTSVYAPLTAQQPRVAPTLGQRLPAGEQTVTAPFVNRIPNRSGQLYMYQYGAVQMPMGMPRPGGAQPAVWESAFQPYVRHLTAWAPSLAFGRIAFPANRGATFRAPQLRTQVTGAAGPGRMGGKPIFGRVQRIPRAARVVPSYDTKSAGG